MPSINNNAYNELKTHSSFHKINKFKKQKTTNYTKNNNVVSKNDFFQKDNKQNIQNNHNNHKTNSDAVDFRSTESIDGLENEYSYKHHNLTNNYTKTNNFGLSTNNVLNNINKESFQNKISNYPSYFVNHTNIYSNNFYNNNSNYSNQSYKPMISNFGQHSFSIEPLNLNLYTVNSNNNNRSICHPYNRNLQNLMNVQSEEMYILNNVDKLLKDQNGCRILQKKFDENSPEFMNTFYKKIKEKLEDIINNQFGNYVIQKFVSSCLNCNVKLFEDFFSDIKEKILKYSNDPYGSRVIQKLLELLINYQHQNSNVLKIKKEIDNLNELKLNKNELSHKVGMNSNSNIVNLNNSNTNIFTKNTINNSYLNFNTNNISNTFKNTNSYFPCPNSTKNSNNEKIKNINFNSSMYLSNNKFIDNRLIFNNYNNPCIVKCNEQISQFNNGNLNCYSPSNKRINNSLLIKNKVELNSNVKTVYNNDSDQIKLNQKSDSENKLNNWNRKFSISGNIVKNDSFHNNSGIMESKLLRNVYGSNYKLENLNDEIIKDKGIFLQQNIKDIKDICDIKDTKDNKENKEKDINEIVEETVFYLNDFAKNHIFSLLSDTNGNHVLQKIFILSRKYSENSLKDEIIKNIVEILKQKQGVGVIHKVIDNCSDEEKVQIGTVIISNLDKLINDEYANFIIPIILNLKDFNMNQKIYEYVVDNLYDLSIKKYSSNVIEKVRFFLFKVFINR